MRHTRIGAPRRHTETSHPRRHRIRGRPPGTTDTAQRHRTTDRPRRSDLHHRDPPALIAATNPRLQQSPQAAYPPAPGIPATQSATRDERRPLVESVWHRGSGVSPPLANWNRSVARANQFEPWAREIRPREATSISKSCALAIELSSICVTSTSPTINTWVGELHSASNRRHSKLAVRWWGRQSRRSLLREPGGSLLAGCGSRHLLDGSRDRPRVVWTGCL